MLPHSIKKIIKRIYHRICFFSGSSYLVSLLTKRKLKILLYHRVAEHEQSTFTNSLRVTPDNFEQQIRYLLRKGYNIISLHEAIHLLNSRKAIPKNTVVITFDDGYRDVYDNAFPILRKYKLPATVFLITGFIDSGNELWIDKIDHALWRTKQKKTCINSKKFNIETRNGKQSLFLYMYELIESLSKDEINKHMHSILDQLAIQNTNTERMLLNWDEIREMMEYKISFGAHGVSHISLAHQAPGVIEEEIAISKHRMDMELNQNTNLFAYPYGQRENFDERVIQCLKEFGFLCALAREEDFNNEYADLFSLKRVSIEGDDSMVDFYNKIAGTGIHRFVKKLGR